MKFYLERPLWRDTIAMRIAINTENSDRFAVAVAMPLAWQTVPRGELAPNEPAAELSTGEAQQLMDELWNIGLRPSEGSGSAGALAAVQNHLEDMRTIAMSQLGIEST